jgi:branched-subunit amino acid transport protein
MRSEVWLVIAGMAVVTYLTRAPLLLALARRPLPPRLRLWLRLIPLAMLPALAIPMVLVVRDPAGARLALAPAHAPLWGAVVVVALATLRVNLLITVALGVAVVAFLRALA